VLYHTNSPLRHHGGSPYNYQEVEDALAFFTKCNEAQQRQAQRTFATGPGHTYPRAWFPERRLQERQGFDAVLRGAAPRVRIDPAAATASRPNPETPTNNASGSQQDQSRRPRPPPHNPFRPRRTTAPFDDEQDDEDVNNGSPRPGSSRRSRRS
jgi:hypothetical protein